MIKSKLILLTLMSIVLVFLTFSNGTTAYYFKSNVSKNVNINVTSQQVFNSTYGGSDDDAALSAVKTSDGGHVLAGYSLYGEYTRKDWLVVKIDSNGQIEWYKTFENGDWAGAKSVITTSDGGYAIAGGRRLIKTDANGRVEWNRTYNGDINSILATSDGGYILAGSIGSSEKPNYINDMWLGKINPIGHIEWNRTYGGATTRGEANSVVTTPDGGYALAGYIDSYGHSRGLYHDILVVKTDANGQMEWNKTFGAHACDEARSIITTSDGGYALAGLTESFGILGSNMWLVKIDANGKMEWNKTYESGGYDRANSIITTSDGGYVLAGSAQLGSNSANDMLVVKTDVKGQVEWKRTFGGGYWEEAFAITTDSDGEYALAGYTGSNDFGEDYDMFFVKFVVSKNPFTNPIESTFLFLLITFSLIGAGLIFTKFVSKIQINNVLMKTTSTPKIQNNPFDSLIKDIELEITDNLLPQNSTTSIRKKALNKMITNDSDISMNKKLNSSFTEKIENRTPLFAILIAPLLWVISQILFPPEVRKLSSTKVNDNPMRQQIIDILHVRDFIHYFALKKYLKCGNARLTWHLQVLEDFELIKRRRFGRVQVFFLRGSFLDEYKLKIYCSIRNKTSLMILELFSQENEDKKDINFLSKKLDKSYQAIKYHCDKLFSLGLLEKHDSDIIHYQVVKIRREYISWLIERYRLEQIIS